MSSRDPTPRPRAPMTPPEILALLPQQRPFRFLDEILVVDEQHIVGRYTFRADEHFYEGHFPDEPITPGVILLESMAQLGVVALGIYLLGLELPKDELVRYKTLFTDSQAEFTGIVRPRDTVHIRAEKVFWRRRKLRSKVEMSLLDGTIVANCVISGMGVSR